tara:strand:- start:703 stop:879 length:177 start_codon:yes stop_codon:yes gene_type:complete
MHVVLRITGQYPDRSMALCTLYPKDIDKLSKLKECVRGVLLALNYIQGIASSMKKIPH